MSQATCWQSLGTCGKAEGRPVADSSMGDKLGQTYKDEPRAGKIIFDKTLVLMIFKQLDNQEARLVCCNHF